MDKTTILNVGMGNVLMNPSSSATFLGSESHPVSSLPLEQMISRDLPYQVINFVEGQEIFREGEVPKGLYYVQSGCAKMMVNRDHARGRTTTSEYVTKLVGAGEYFGYKSLIKGTKSNSTAVAVKPTTLWLYSKDVVEKALQISNPLVKFLLKQAVMDIENYENISQLHYLASVQERIAHQLLLLAEKFGVHSEKGISLNLKLTRNEFAQLASTINESLSRHLTEFKAEGLIDINGKEIIIKDKQGLKVKSAIF